MDPGRSADVARRDRPAGRNRRVGAVGAGCLAIVACAGTERGVDLPMPANATGTAVMHAVHDGQLRVAMRDLHAGSLDRLPQELDDPARDLAYLREASARAQDLADTADRIAAVVDRIGLTSEQQPVFLGLAARLHDRALRLRAQADRRQTRLIRTTLTEIDETCISCHTLFREAPGSSDGR